VLVMVMAVVAFGNIARAEGETTAPGTEAAKPAQYNYELRQKIEAQREALKNEFQVKREAFKTELKAKKEAFQATLKTEREVFKTKLEVEKKEFKANIKEKRGEFRGKAKEVLNERFEATIKNIVNLQGKVEAKIAILKAAGKDTTQAEVYLSDSKTKLADAQTKLAEIRALIPKTDDKITVDNWEKIKLGASDVKNLLKESHNFLKEAVKVLKGLGKIEKPEGEDENEASSTGTSNQ